MYTDEVSTDLDDAFSFQATKPAIKLLKNREMPR